MHWLTNALCLYCEVSGSTFHAFVLYFHDSIFLTVSSLAECEIPWSRSIIFHRSSGRTTLQTTHSLRSKRLTSPSNKKKGWRSSLLILSNPFLAAFFYSGIFLNAFANSIQSQSQEAVGELNEGIRGFLKVLNPHNPTQTHTNPHKSHSLQFSVQFNSVPRIGIENWYPDVDHDSSYMVAGRVDDIIIYCSRGDCLNAWNISKSDALYYYDPLVGVVRH